MMLLGVSRDAETGAVGRTSFAWRDTSRLDALAPAGRELERAPHPWVRLESHATRRSTPPG